MFLVFSNCHMISCPDVRLCIWAQTSQTPLLLSPGLELVTVTQLRSSGLQKQDICTRCNNNNTGGDKVNQNIPEDLEHRRGGGQGGARRGRSDRFVCQPHTALKTKPSSVWWSENFPFSHLLRTAFTREQGFLELSSGN